MDRFSQNEQSKWTVAIDLSTDVRDMNGDVTGGGAFDKWRQLKTLVEQTARSPVSVVVSLPHVDAIAADANDLKSKVPNLFQEATKVRDPQSPSGTQIDTYVISGGKMRLAETHTSLGLDRDVEQLLQTARKEAPSQRLALTIFAHGEGTEQGMLTDWGYTSTEALHDGIKRGLGDRGKLDVLDFDACKMASTITAGRMQDVAKFMVASADDEIAATDKGFNGQNLTAAIKGLIAQPDKTPEKLASGLVDQARTGINGRPVWVPDIPGTKRAATDTLIAIDLERYAQFERNLSALATSLRPALERPSDRAVIGAAIDRTPSFPSHTRPAVAELRDTKQFAQKILEQISKGKLVDDGSIKRAAEAVLDSQKQMTVSLHSRLNNTIGGISTFLPVTSAQSRREMLRSQFVIQSLADLPAYKKRIELKPLVEQQSLWALSSRSTLPKHEAQQFSGMVQAQQRIASATTQPEYLQRVTQLEREARKFMKSGLAERMVRELGRTAHPVDGDPKRNEWTAFVDDLIDKSKTRH